METIEQNRVKEPQTQERPGFENEMTPTPIYDDKHKKGSGKLLNKVAVITGGDSGIGRAVAILFAKEGADVAVVYLNEHDDARTTQKEVENYGRECLLISGDLESEDFCKSIIDRVVDEFETIDILVNNAAVQFEQERLEDISTAQLMKTFTTNIFSFFWLTKAALPYMKKGSTIVNSTSVTAYRGSSHLIDYASTKGAIVAFTRSLAQNLVERGIRVNAVAPGPIWTPLITSSFEPERVAKHGSSAPMQRSGEPVEVAPSYLFLACDDSSYMSGQVLHPNGGEVING
ncbi:MAG TPA: SDR family oxidoreductase [Bacteroidales bacterium]|nr:SDR family oxidoreductase [Bacteroidales bacterium]